MGKHGHQRYHIQFWMHNRPTTGKRIGGRAGWSSHNESITALAVNELPIDEQFKLNHADRFTGVHHNFVKRVAISYGDPIAVEHSIQQEALFNLKLPRQHFAYPGL